MRRDLFFFGIFFFSFLQLADAQVNYTALDQVSPYSGRFRAGVNFGYYPLWGNQQQADVAAGNPATNQQGVGARAIRQGMYENPLEIFGYNLLEADFNHFDNLNMSNGEAVAIVGGPVEWHRDLTNYCASDPTKLSKFFGNMYTPIWDGGANGTPYNDDNFFAAYLFKVVTQYKDDVRFWEIWNEPGLDFGACGWRPPGDQTCNWWDRDPDPCELDLGAPIEHYVRALRIAWEVIKTVDPDSYVCLGSMGYQAGLDAVLRNTDNPVDGSVTAEYPLLGGAYFDCVTMHCYPHFDGSTLNYDGGIFERHSDRAADGIFLFRDGYQGILNNYGFDGSQYPKKEYIITEVNAPRHSYPAGQYFAGEIAQRNYIQKAYIVAKLERIGSMHVYQLFDRKTPATANYEFDEMGMYKTIEPNGTNTIGPFGQQINDEGIAFKTVSDLIYSTDFDPIETAKMGLSTTSSTRGYAFKRTDGQYVYVLWARTETDLSEAASSNYSFPATMGLSTLTRHNWDWAGTNTTSVVGSTNISLDATPVFFVGGTATQTCAINASVNEVVCNNNNTPNDPSDDTFSFSLLVNSNGNCSTGWALTSGATGSGTYNISKSFGPFPISGGNKVLTIRDNTSATSTTSVTAFAPAPCSSSGNACVITPAFSNVQCSNNGTPNNTGDDTYTFSVVVNKNVTCTSTQWQSGSITGTYGSATTFGPYPISSGNTSLNFVALGQTPIISASINVPAPAPCSSGGGNTCANNLLQNAGFESSLNSWNLGSGVTAVGGGNAGSAGAASLCTNGQRMYQTVAGTAGSTYTFQAYAKSTGGAATATLAIKYLSSAWSPIQQDFAPIAATATYSLFSISKAAPTGTAYIEISVLKETGTGCIVVDDICLGTSGGGGTNPTVSFVNCQQNITVTAASAATSALVTYATPTATATNCSTMPTVTRTSGLVSGSAFPIGISQVVYTATCGTATATCAFSITVEAGSTGGGGCANNLLLNASFENNGLATWNADPSVTLVSGGANSTNNAASICANAERVYLTLPATAGKAYFAQLRAKNSGGPSSGVIVIKFLDNSWTPLISDFGPMNSVTSTYKTFTATEMSPPGTAYVELSALKLTGAGCLIVDELCLTDETTVASCSLNAAVSNVQCNNNGTPTIATDDTFTFNVMVNSNGSCGTGYTTSGGLTGSGTYGVAKTFGPLSIASASNLNLTFTDNTTATTQTSVAISPPATCSSGGGGNGVDLELTMSTPTPNPGIWQSVALSLTIKNNGTTAATGVQVGYLAQSATATSNVLAYIAHTAPAGTSFNAWAGTWNVGNLAAGESKTLVYEVFTKSNTAIPAFGQVIAQSPNDTDSSPNNNTTGVPNEDDETRILLNASLLKLEAGRTLPTETFVVEDFTIYPNPAGERMALSLEAYMDQPVQVSVLNQYGRTVLQQNVQKLESAIMNFELHDLSNGFYMIRVESPGKRAIVKKMTVMRTY